MKRASVVRLGLTPALCAKLDLADAGVEVNIAVKTEEGTNLPENIYFIPTPGLAVSNKNGLQLRTFSNKKVYEYLVEHVLKTTEMPTADVVLEVEVVDSFSIAPWAIKVLPLAEAPHPFDDVEEVHHTENQDVTEHNAEEQVSNDVPSWASDRELDLGELAKIAEAEAVNNDFGI